MNRKFIIFAPPYDELIGGSIALHKLCSVLNELGFESYVTPYRESYVVDQHTWHRYIWRFIKWRIRDHIRSFNTNPNFLTPIFKGVGVTDDFIAIYPEIVFGNPLGAKHVVRWFLHQPGFHNQRIYFGKNELYFKFNSSIRDFHFEGSTTSSTELKVIDYPLHYYNLTNTAVDRTGTAYCLRKGQGKRIQHDLSDSILIDGKNHDEVARIFKRVKRFISYDPLTAYSVLAVMCGCESVVIPDDNVTEDEWCPNHSDRWGIAYGWNNLADANRTAPRVRAYVWAEHERIRSSVLKAVTEMQAYFPSGHPIAQRIK